MPVRLRLEKSEVEDLLINLRIELSRAVKENLLESEIEAENWQNIFNGLFSSELANSFMENMDKDLFFSFGEYLASFSNQSNEKIVSIIHNYLNLFRNSTFLQKIYNEPRWDNLIHSSYRSKLITLLMFYLISGSINTKRKIFSG